jgi:hypothetical protein
VANSSHILPVVDETAPYQHTSKSWKEYEYACAGEGLSQLEDSQSRETVKFGHGSRGTRNKK